MWRIPQCSVLVLVALILFAGRPVTAVAADDEAVQTAIKNGVKYLQAMHQPQQTYNGGSHNMGSATLAGLALLESGIDESDPAVQNIVKYVRERALSETRTYELSLTIMFLDRLGHDKDRPVIQLLGVRLIAGQGRTGGWSYECGNRLSAEEEARLRAEFAKDTKLVSRPSVKDDPPKKEPGKSGPRSDLPNDPKAPPDPKKDPAKKDGGPAKPPDERPALHPEVAKWARLISTNGDPLVGGGGDNSNTQFAALGVWCARRHGVPCDRALALLERRFQVGQNADGGWGYTEMPMIGGPGFVPPAIGTLPGRGSSPAMTCAGLIGFAVGLGARRNQPVDRDGLDDPAIKKALKCLGGFITAAKGDAPRLEPLRKGRARFRVDMLNSNLYFLWSLERVAVIYGLETIGNHDWYTWGADGLVDSQGADGSWGTATEQHATGRDISTSFALLFLNRANVAKDLTTKLRGRVKDPGQSVLRGGNSGGKLPPDRTSPKPDPKDPPAKSDPTPSKPPTTVVGTDFEKEAARLCTTLVQASAADRAGILAQLRDSKGGVYTEALARAIPKLSGDAQREARDALARRLTRMTVATLREMLRDDNGEVRCAAAAACGFKEDRQLVPELINSLNDTEQLVVNAAHTSLKTLSGRDFGPEGSSSAADRAKSIQEWKSWWNAQIK
jgi:hypothetical protein